MAYLSDSDVSAGRALVLSVAKLWELVDSDGKLVIHLSDKESYAEADGIDPEGVATDTEVERGSRVASPEARLANLARPVLGT